MKNLLLILLFPTGLTYSQITFTDTLNCQGDTTTLTYTVPSTGGGNIIWNCDIITDGYLTSVILPSNPNEPIQTQWTTIYTIDTSMFIVSWDFTFPPYTFTYNGCYRFNLISNCASGETITLSSTWYVSILGIDEILINQCKPIKVIDLMGRPTEVIPNKLLLYQYENGSIEKIYITQ